MTIAQQHMPPTPNPTLFSSGQVLGDLVVASDLVHHSWAAIQKDNSSCPGGDLIHKPTKTTTTTPLSPFSVTCTIYPQQPKTNFSIVAFTCSSSPSSTKHHQPGGEGASGVLSPTLQVQKDGLPFNFLYTKDITSISINEEAINLFLSLEDTLKESLSRLPEQLGLSTTLIITGQSIGGSVASLFTLWLLENMPASTDNKKTSNLPLCITFGSPLVGDHGLRQAILNHSWHSRFLHIVSDQDHFLPRLFISSDSALAFNQVAASHTSRYKPFGTFLLCSQSGCACFEDPDSVLELKAAMGSNPGSNEGSQMVNNVDYGEILKHLRDGLFVCSGVSQLLGSSSLRAGLALQLVAVGVKRKQQHENNEDDTLITAMEKREKKNQLRVFNADKKLNDIKVLMANLEWYKKVSVTDGIGYYDSYKRQQSTNKRDMDVNTFKLRLTIYWEDEVREAERKPRKQGTRFPTRWLYSGITCKRMLEPLDIAEYYKNGKKDYRTKGRSNHYIMLEKWQKEDKEEERATGHQRNEKTRNKATTLTEDSCFWADVEEALILTNSLKNGEESSWEKLKMFECYVLSLINSYAVSPEIFLQGSSFMHWWGEYEKVIKSSKPEHANSSQLFVFMKNHEQYS